MTCIEKRRFNVIDHIAQVICGHEMSIWESEAYEKSLYYPHDIEPETDALDCLDEERFDNYTLESVQQIFPWVGQFHTTDISSNYSLPQLAHIINIYCNWNKTLFKWMAENLSGEQTEQVLWEKRISSYFRKIPYRSRATAFARVMNMPITMARRCIILRTSRIHDEVILISSLVKQPESLSIEDTIEQLTEWKGKETQNLLEKLQRLSSKLIQVVRQKHPDLLDQEIERIPYCQLDPSIPPLVDAFCEVRYSLAYLKRTRFFWNPYSELIHAKSGVKGPTYLDPEVPYAPLVYRPEALYEYIYGLKSLEVDVNELKRLLQNIPVNAHSRAKVTFSALKNPYLLVPFRFEVPKMALAAPYDHFTKHCLHFKSLPKFYFEREFCETPPLDHFTHVTFRGYILLEEESVPRPVLKISSTVSSTVTLELFRRHCTTCGDITHPKFQCPIDIWKYCENPRHWKKTRPWLHEEEEN